MNPDIKQKWVEALRSGEYRQGRGTLETVSGENCCLGVLCRVVGVESFINRGTIDLKGVIFRYKDSINAQALPRELAADLGVEIGAMAQLMSMNDRGYSFNEIADWIEANL